MIGRHWISAVLVALLVVATAGQQSDGKRSKTVKKQLKMEPEPDAPEVELSLGWLSGRWLQTRGGRKVAAFTAVPYAKAPIDNLRFKAPVTPEPWTGTRESPPLEQVPVCMQGEDPFTHDMPRSEDCLYLNVFTPTPVNGSKLPVLVWVHGGWFHEGGAAAYGPEYLLDRDLVLVTINYRLGALGFLSTGDSASPGNWGLKDQQMALRWVHENIEALGGDPGSVSVIGHSAGGMSAHFHLMARSNRGLFQRAVSLGGTALSMGGPQSATTARGYATKLAAKLGCPTTPSSALVSCLRTKTAHDLLAQEASKDMCPFITWGPVVEDFVGVADKERQTNPPFLEMHPVDALTNGLTLDVPWLAGLNLNEGGLWTAIIQASKQIEAFDVNLDSMAPLCFSFNHSADPEELQDIVQEIREFYLGTNNITKENLNDLANMFTDGAVLYSLDEAMRLHAAYSAGPAYLYLFSHRGHRSLTDQFSKEGPGGPYDLGVAHGDELTHLFPLKHVLPARENAPQDRKVSDKLIDLLLNFAKSGNPTPEGDSRYPFPWKPVESEELEFLEIGRDGRLFKGAGLLGYRAHFWSALPLSERNKKNMRASVFQQGRHDEF